MCMICADLVRGAMTTREARNAYSEVVVKIAPEHQAEVLELIEINEQDEILSALEHAEATSARG